MDREPNHDIENQSDTEWAEQMQALSDEVGRQPERAELSSERPMTDSPERRAALAAHLRRMGLLPDFPE